MTSILRQALARVDAAETAERHTAFAPARTTPKRRPALEQIPKRFQPVMTPREMFERSAAPSAAFPGNPPRRVKTSADYLADADAAGVELVEVQKEDGSKRWAWRCGMRSSSARFISPAGAAYDWAHVTGIPKTVTATSFFTCQGWLAYALEERGEVVRHMPDGSGVWACTESAFDPDNSPAIRAVFEALIAGVA